jgi:ABC-type polysaccharide/polyol phosphate transport system ATPase subunit
MPEPILELTRVSKRYRMRHEKPFLARHLVQRLIGRRAAPTEFWALREVDLSMEPGEAVALIGHNGAGKSTLLQIAAGTTRPTTGRVTTRGWLTPLLELGTGFQFDLSGRENIYLNAAFLGLNRREVEARLPRIIEFADLGDFLDARLSTYSSGMILRLGFAVAVSVEPDMLIFDEVLAVGDAAFRVRCLERLEQMQAAGCTLLIASHDVVTMQRFCKRTIWLDHGRVMRDGPSEAVVADYIEAMKTPPTA